MAKNVLGVAAGAGAATAYLRPDLVAGYALESLFPAPSLRGSGRVGSDNSRELEELHKLVEQLSRDVNSSKQGVTIVHSGTDRTAGYATYTVAVAGVGVVLYLTVFRGWRLSDFLYVTRRSLQQGLGKLNTRLDAISGRLVELRARLQAKLMELSGKQDETIAAQKVLGEQLRVVGKEVESTCSQVRQIHGLVYDMDASLVEVGTNQRHANHGIYILCKAVGELMAGHNIPSKAELIEYTQHPIWHGDRLQGLQSVLENSEAGASTRRTPFLLNPASLPLASDRKRDAPGGAPGRYGFDADTKAGAPQLWPNPDPGTPSPGAMGGVAYPAHASGSLSGLHPAHLGTAW